MKMRLYQIDPERDTEQLAFIGLEKVKDRMDYASYDCVFDGEVFCSNLEEAFEKFNLDLPDGFVGHSMSVSDVVEVMDGTDQVKPGFYFCDSFGFKEIYFDPEETQQKSLIKVVLVEPGKYAKPTDIDPSLTGLQQVVGGLIETYYPFEEQVCIVCNDEGKINGKLQPCNRQEGYDVRKGAVSKMRRDDCLPRISVLSARRGHAGASS